MTATFLSTSDAVNIVLRGAGLAETSSSLHPESVIAQEYIDNVTTQVLAKGYYFNRESNVTLSRTGTEVILTDDVLRVIPVPTQKWVARGNKLFNLETNTYDFTEDPTAVELVRILDWSEIPQTVRLYIAYEAAAQFATDYHPNTSRDRANAAKAARALLEVNVEETENSSTPTYSETFLHQMQRGWRSQW